MTIFEIVTIAAIIGGPIFGVVIGRHLQNRGFEHDRRMEIFRTLMRTRRTPTLPEHVGSLNLVEIEFRRDPKVIEAWKALFKHLGTQHPRRPDEVVPDGANEQGAGARDTAYGNRLHDERQRLLAKLLHAMAKAVGFKIEQLEIFEGGYTPQGWADVELEQTVIRRFFAHLAVGQRAIPVAVLDYVHRPVDPGHDS